MAGSFRIGDWDVDPSTGRIECGGRVAHLESRPLRLLLCLADRPGDVVGVEELLDVVWPDVTVSQDSLYQAVAALRRHLGDDPKLPAYIATVPRRGYRLVATVSRPQPPSPVARSFHRRRLARIAAALALTLIAGSSVPDLPRPFAPPSVFARNSMAVLPFLDLTGAAKSEEYVADGMTEELIDRLSRIPGLRIPPPTASFYFKDKRTTVTEIAKELHVAFVLDGSLRRSGEKLRVAVRLIEGASGFVLWSGTYDRPSGDVLKVQDDIAASVAKALRPCFVARMHQARRATSL